VVERLLHVDRGIDGEVGGRSELDDFEIGARGAKRDLADSGGAAVLASRNWRSASSTVSSRLATRAWA